MQENLDEVVDTWTRKREGECSFDPTSGQDVHSLSSAVPPEWSGGLKSIGQWQMRRRGEWSRAWTSDRTERTKRSTPICARGWVDRATSGSTWSSRCELRSDVFTATRSTHSFLSSISVGIVPKWEEQYQRSSSRTRSWGQVPRCGQVDHRCRL